jgi:hypothetical protein
MSGTCHQCGHSFCYLKAHLMSDHGRNENPRRMGPYIPTIRMEESGYIRVTRPGRSHRVN